MMLLGFPDSGNAETSRGEADPLTTQSAASAPNGNTTVGETASMAARIDEALSATPPERSKYGRAFADDPQAIKELEQWIENTQTDDPKNLVMRDILLAMPINVSGPMLVALAKKSRDPAIQASWKRHLEKYPGPYANVLSSWLLAEADDPQHFYAVFKEYAELRPAQAASLWAVLVKNNTSQKLGRVFEYGLSLPDAPQALQKSFSPLPNDETQKLRLYRAVILCSARQQSPAFEPDEAILSDLQRLFSATAVSRRIVAIDMAGALQAAALVPKLADAFQNSKNTTERAHALAALTALEPSAHAADIQKSLTDGDEILRMTSANLLDFYPQILQNTDPQVIRTAFEKELWPQTQLSLYKALKTSDPGLPKAVLLGNQYAPTTRMAAALGLSPQQQASLSLNDLAQLQRDEAPLDLIATTAEYIFAHHPENRETLRTWIAVQHPFERRLLTTFSRFVAIDSRESNDVQPYVREVCAHAVEDENILHPCVAYFEDRGSTDADKELLSQLKARQKQFNLMMDL